MLSPHSPHQPNHPLVAAGLGGGRAVLLVGQGRSAQPGEVRLRRPLMRWVPTQPLPLPV